MRKIAWSVAHQEFIISDHYYFSKLQKYAKEAGLHIEEVDEIEKFSQYDTIIFNYPEIPFTSEEADFIEDLVKKGKTVGIFGYYKNEDSIADTCNTLSERFGIHFNGDIITDSINNYENDNLLIVTGDTYNPTRKHKKGYTCLHRQYNNKKASGKAPYPWRNNSRVKIRERDSSVCRIR
ncbi:MAG: hypothetical protein Q9M89_05640 [Persephonella sp.]|nr:hypothetical protein [Persephonella sp.]